MERAKVREKRTIALGITKCNRYSGCDSCRSTALRTGTLYA